MGQENRFSTTALVLAGLLHWWAMSGEWSSTERGEEESVEPIEITLMDRDKQVVQTSRPEEQEDSDEPVEFYGESRNRVKKQSQSAITGRFQPGVRIIPPSLGEDGVGEGEEEAAPEMSDLLAFAMTPNRIPNSIPEGAQTLLNTDGVLYASFINRVADEIYDPWVSRVTRAVEFRRLNGHKLAANTYITRLTVVLNREGKIASITTLRSSGVPALDDASKQSFWETEPFPNPPEQMFEDDGLVRFVYEFHFEYKSSGFNIVPMI